MSPTLRQMHRREHAKKLAHDTIMGLKPWTNTRYMERDVRSVVHRRQDNPNLAWVDNYWSIGLRIVGHVNPEPKPYEIWQPSDDRLTGWYTNNDAESTKTGDGLAWGVVFQLPTRQRRVQFLPGYFIDGQANLVVDFSEIYSEPFYDISDPQLYPSAEHAARVADKMAEQAAEDEREYQLEQQEND